MENGTTNGATPATEGRTPTDPTMNGTGLSPLMVELLENLKVKRAEAIRAEEGAMAIRQSLPECASNVINGHVRSLTRQEIESHAGHAGAVYAIAMAHRAINNSGNYQDDMERARLACVAILLGPKFIEIEAKIRKSRQRIERKHRRRLRKYNRHIRRVRRNVVMGSGLQEANRASDRAIDALRDAEHAILDAPIATQGDYHAKLDMYRELIGYDWEDGSHEEAFFSMVRNSVFVPAGTASEHRTLHQGGRLAEQEE